MNNNWNKLSMRDKHLIMREYISLNRDESNSYAGGGLEDIADSYEEFTLLDNDKFLTFAENQAKQWTNESKAPSPINKDLLEQEILTEILNDNTYNYRQYVKDNFGMPLLLTTKNGAHFNDRYKTVYHPTFSNQSIYSGQKSKYNPNGIIGGNWSEDGLNYTLSNDLINNNWDIDRTLKYLNDAEGNPVTIRNSYNIPIITSSTKKKSNGGNLFLFGGEEDLYPFANQGQQLGAITKDIIGKYYVNPDLIKQRLLWAESNNNPNATSKSGAIGSYQVMPNALLYYNEKNKTNYTTKDLYNHDTNEKNRDWIMKDLMDSTVINKSKSSDKVATAKALAAYNWGRGNLSNYLVELKKKGVDIYNSLDWINGLPKESRDYINFILLNKDVGGNKTNAAYNKAFGIKANGGNLFLTGSQMNNPYTRTSLDYNRGELIYESTNPITGEVLYSITDKQGNEVPLYIQDNTDEDKRNWVFRDADGNIFNRHYDNALDIQKRDKPLEAVYPEAALLGTARAVANGAVSGTYNLLKPVLEHPVTTNLFAADGAYNLASEDGLLKSWDLYKNGQYGDMALSLAGDAMNGLIVLPAAYKGAKYTYDLGKQGWNWANRNYVLPYNLYREIGNTSPVLEELNPTVRTRLGDVEIDNPNLYYHKDKGDGISIFGHNGAFIKDGHIYPGKTSLPNQLDYVWWSKGKSYVDGNANRLVVTADDPNLIHVRSQDYPIGQWNGKSGFVTNLEYVSTNPIDVRNSVFKYDPNYGYRKITTEPEVSTIDFNAARTIQELPSNILLNNGNEVVNNSSRGVNLDNNLLGYVSLEGRSFNLVKDWSKEVDDLAKMTTEQRMEYFKQNPDYAALLSDINFMNDNNAYNFDVWADAQKAANNTDYSIFKGGSSVIDTFKKMQQLQYQDYITGRLKNNIFNNYSFTVPELGQEKLQQIPEWALRELNNSTISRMAEMRGGEGPLVDNLNKEINRIYKEGYTEYPESAYTKAGQEQFAGFYSPDNDFVSIREGLTDFALPHEVRHKLDYAVPLTEEEENVLASAYDLGFIDLGNNTELWKGKTIDMNPERVTTNRDARAELLGTMHSERTPINLLNKIIYKMPDSKIFEAVERANGYGRKFINYLREHNLLTPEKALLFRESMKKVGVVLPATITTGIGLSTASTNSKALGGNLFLNNNSNKFDDGGYTTYLVDNNDLVRLNPETGGVQVLGENGTPIVNEGGFELPAVEIKPNIWTSIARRFINLFVPMESYKNEQKPYNDIMNINNGSRVYRSEMIGMHKPDEYYPNSYFSNPNYKQPKDKDVAAVLDFIGEGNDNWSRKLRGCAKNANLISGYYGKPTAGDAWTRHGIYGDSVIVVNPDINKDNYNTTIGRNFNMINKNNGDYVEQNIDNHFLKSGDIVDLYYKGSHSRNKAYEQGDYNRANTHTGTIIRTGKGKDEVYVAHDTGEGIVFLPINELIGTGLTKKSYITGIRRPGTHSHLYKDSKGNIIYNKR